EVAGTLVQGDPRIVFIDGFWVDVPVEGHLLLTKHQDKPGLVGRVGTLLGEHDVNISSMQVGRLHPRGEALMILTLDDAVPDEVQQVIDQIDEELVQTHDPEREDFLVTVFKSEELGFYSDEFDADDAVDDDEEEER